MDPVDCLSTRAMNGRSNSQSDPADTADIVDRRLTGSDRRRRRSMAAGNTGEDCAVAEVTAAG